MSILKAIKRTGLAISFLIKLGLALTILLPVMTYASGGSVVDVITAGMFPMSLIFAELNSMISSMRISA